MPVGGDWLEADLRSAAGGLAGVAHDRPPAAYRAILNRVVILAALGHNVAAVTVADRVLEMSPFSPQVRFIRRTVHHHAGHGDQAMREIEQGLALQPDEPGLLN